MIMTCFEIIFLGIVKRGTIEDIGDSLGDALGINNKGILEEIEDIDVSHNPARKTNQTKYNFRKPSIVSRTVGV